MIQGAGKNLPLGNTQRELEIGEVERSLGDAWLVGWWDGTGR